MNILLFLSILLSANSESLNSSYITPPHVSLNQTEFFFVKSTAINCIIPTITGDDVRVYVAPGLPLGLRIDKFTGIISGKPSDIVSRSAFTITVKNEAGEDSTFLYITITDKAIDKPRITLWETKYSFHQNSPIRAIQPHIYGPDISLTIIPMLPFGLHLNFSTGEITGTPKYPSENTTYTLTVSNMVGCASKSFSMVILEGHSTLPVVYLDERDLVYTCGSEIFPFTPVIEGKGITLFLEPELPMGLVINNQTGMISGTPLVEMDKTEYTITAKNSISSAYATFTIFVDSAAVATPEVVYDKNEYIFTKGVEIEPIIPMVSGGGLSMHFQPALPCGLEVNPVNGRISGTPCYVKSPMVYTLFVVNRVGQTNVSLTISVEEFVPSAVDIQLDQENYSIQQGVSMIPIEPIIHGDEYGVTIFPPLPFGLSMDPSTGRIQGVPTFTQVRTGYTMSVLNAVSSAFVEFTLEIGQYHPEKPTIRLDTTEYIFVLGEMIESIKPVVTGTDVEIAVYPIMVNGLSIDKQTGVISGIPTQEKSKTTFTLVAVNKVGHDSVTFNLTVVKTTSARDCKYCGMYASSMDKENEVVVLRGMMHHTPIYLHHRVAHYVDEAISYDVEVGGLLERSDELQATLMKLSVDTAIIQFHMLPEKIGFSCDGIIDIEKEYSVEELVCNGQAGFDPFATIRARVGKEEEVKFEFGENELIVNDSIKLKRVSDEGCTCVHSSLRN